MTLTDFLLARIAEDEATARDDGADAMVGWRWKHYPPEAYEVVQALTLRHSRRVLAECEAKRRIVELCAPGDWSGPHWHPIGEAGEDDRGDVLALLVLPYAAHPDYREEWKP